MDSNLKGDSVIQVFVGFGRIYIDLIVFLFC